MIIDGMDMDTLITFAFDSIMGNIETWTEDEVKGEILDLYDEETLEGLMPTDVIEVSYGTEMKAIQLRNWSKNPLIFVPFCAIVGS